MIVESILSHVMYIVTKLTLTSSISTPEERLFSGIDQCKMLYVHVPLCHQLCPYCSFHRVLFSESLAHKYFDCLEREIDLYAEKGFEFTTAYIGGGTPTVLPKRINDFILKMKSIWPTKDASIETNPDCLTSATISILKYAGVNRLSIGVQTFQDDLLVSVQRKQKLDGGREVRNRVQNAICQFDTVNVI